MFLRDCCGRVEKMQERRVWLLTFSTLGPSVTVEQMCLMGGFQLDECCTATGLSHHFCLLKFSIGLEPELSSVNRFLQRVKFLLGVVSASVPTSGVDDIVMCKHYAVRLMVDRKKQGGNGLSRWMREGIVPGRGLIDYYVKCSGIERQNGNGQLDNVKATRHCLLQSLANVRRSIFVQECHWIGAVVKKEFGKYSVKESRKLESRKRRIDEVENVVLKTAGMKQQSISSPSQYFPEVRPNDDNWTSGWA